MSLPSLQTFWFAGMASVFIKSIAMNEIFDKLYEEIPLLEISNSTGSLFFAIVTFVGLSAAVIYLIVRVIEKYSTDEKVQSDDEESSLSSFIEQKREPSHFILKPEAILSQKEAIPDFELEKLYQRINSLERENLSLRLAHPEKKDKDHTESKVIESQPPKPLDTPQDLKVQAQLIQKDQEIKQLKDLLTTCRDQILAITKQNSTPQEKKRA